MGSIHSLALIYQTKRHAANKKKRKSILPFNDLDRKLGEGGGKEYQNTGIDGMGLGGVHLDGILFSEFGVTLQIQYRPNGKPGNQANQAR